MYGLSSNEAARLDAWLTREPPEPDFDCDCGPVNHDDCGEEDCACMGHDGGCDMCQQEHGCICNELCDKAEQRKEDDYWEDGE